MADRGEAPRVVEVRRHRQAAVVGGRGPDPLRGAARWPYPDPLLRDLSRFQPCHAGPARTPGPPFHLEGQRPVDHRRRERWHCQDARGEGEVMRGLKDKVAVVAGGAGGIGTATSVRLAQEGCSVVVGDLNDDAATAVAKQITDAGGTAVAVRVDISDERSVNEMVALAVATYGGVEILHANAADPSAGTLGRDSNALDIDLDAFDRTLAVNLRGHLLCTRAALPEILKRGGGALVYTSSGAAFMGEPERPSYAC